MKVVNRPRRQGLSSNTLSSKADLAAGRATAARAYTRALMGCSTVKSPRVIPIVPEATRLRSSNITAAIKAIPKGNRISNMLARAIKKLNARMKTCARMFVRSLTFPMTRARLRPRGDELVLSGNETDLCRAVKPRPGVDSLCLPLPTQCPVGKDCSR